MKCTENELYYTRSEADAEQLKEKQDLKKKKRRCSCPALGVPGSGPNSEADCLS